MEKHDRTYCIEVWADQACFTRPEFKVERMSYDVITPSAARGVFEAIFWKPALRWQITKIEVLNPIKWHAIRRNEVGALANSNKKQIFIEKERQQRNALMLKEVRYRLHATLVYIPPHLRKNQNRAAMPDENPAKYHAMFERRAQEGQCFNQPYLGTRECSAFFRLVNEPEEQRKTPITEDKDLGIMLYDIDHSNPKDTMKLFYRATMKQGVIEVPHLDSEEVLR